VALDIRWNWESETGDVYEAIFRGTKSRIELRQGAAEHFVPTLYVVSQHPEVFAALDQWADAMQKTYPGLGIEKRAGEARIAVPRQFAVGHEDHFGQVTNRFFEYLKAPATLPAWEQSNMLVKYFVSTRGVEIAR
jgi:hypothetical protein